MGALGSVVAFYVRRAIETGDSARIVGCPVDGYRSVRKHHVESAEYAFQQCHMFRNVCHGDEVQKMVVDDMISTGHARALISIEDPEEQYLIAQKIFDEKLSVREVEKLVKDLHKPPKPPKEENKTLQAIYQEISERLKQSLSTKVSVSAKQNGAGKIEIEFYNHEDLERLLERITG